MWTAKFDIKHDCILGNRCEKYKIMLQSTAQNIYVENGKHISSSMHYITGNETSIDEFINDLSKDKKVISIERKNNVFFLLEKAEGKAVQFFTKKLIFTKPVVMDESGTEHWEVSSWERKELEEFLKNVRKNFDNYKLLKLREIKTSDIFFPRLIPNLTKKQKNAIELAIKNGYYENPHRTTIKALAKIAGVSVATYQQHLRTAEEKLLPNLFYYIH